MADPTHVKLVNDTGILYDPTSQWTISGKEVKPFPTNAAAKEFVRDAIDNDLIEAATQQEYWDFIVSQPRGEGSVEDAPEGKTIGMIVRSFDAVDGDFTTVDAPGLSSAIPRANVEDVQVLIYAGDNMGIWTITDTGPCIPGPDPERVPYTSPTGIHVRPIVIADELIGYRLYLHEGDLENGGAFVASDEDHWVPQAPDSRDDALNQLASRLTAVENDVQGLLNP